MRTTLLAICLFTTMTIASAQDHGSKEKAGPSGQKNSATRLSATGVSGAVAPSVNGPNLQVLGSGTLGRLPKWTGITGANSIIGDSSITEDKNGFVGIGTLPADSRLTVNGAIQSLSGGFRFPDGTIQTTSALSSLVHDATLTGNGTPASPIGVSVPLVLNGTLSSAVVSITNSGSGAGVSSESATGVGVFGSGRIGVSGISDNGTGIDGETSSGVAVNGLAASGTGVFGASTNGVGVRAFSADGIGLFSQTLSQDTDDAGIIGAGSGLQGGIAGRFFGDVKILGFNQQPGNLAVSGTLVKAGGSFKIDHPLDPANKYLSHSFVESPDMMNIYNGNAALDSNGEAVVVLPKWFEALNNEFRYLLTAIGAPGPGLYIAEEIRGNQFKISGGTAGMKVSWQVTGIRHDPWANKNRIMVEEDKPDRERGHYLHPEAYNQRYKPGTRHN